MNIIFNNINKFKAIKKKYINFCFLIRNQIYKYKILNA